MMTGYGFGLGGILMMGAWILFLVFLVAGVVWLVAALGRSQRAADTSSGALHILEERLARGEIDTEEFRARRAAIEGSAR